MPFLREHFRGLALSADPLKSTLNDQSDDEWVSVGHKSKAFQGFPGIPTLLEDENGQNGKATFINLFAKRNLISKMAFGKMILLFTLLAGKYVYTLNAWERLGMTYILLSLIFIMSLTQRSSIVLSI